MNTKLTSALALCVCTFLVACASAPSAPAGLEPGKFVAFSCEGAPMQARWNPEANTVRVRSHHGAAELSRGEGGVFEGDGYTLTTKEGIALSHAGKSLSKNCKRA
jgi:hypothetical protein